MGEEPASAADSPPDRRRELDDALRTISEDCASARRMQALVQLPDSCVGLFRVAANLARIRDELHELAVDEDITRVVCDWAESVCRIGGESDLRRIDPLTASHEGASGRGPFQGYLESHPVWCALWFAPHEPAKGDRARYRRLQALLLATYGRLASQGESDNYRRKLYQAGRLVRELRTLRHRLRLRRLAADPYDPEAARDRCADERDTPKGTIYGMVWRRLGATIGLLEQAFELEPLRKPSFGASGGEPWLGYTRPSWFYIDLPADHTRYWVTSVADERAWGNGEVVTYESLPAAHEREDVITAGTTPEEYAIPSSATIDWRELEDSRGETVESAPPASSRRQSDQTGESVQSRRADHAPGELPPLRTQYARARGRARRVKMDIQHLPWHYHRVRRPHIGHIVRVLSEAYDEIGAGHLDHTPLRDALLSAAIALVTGARLDELTRIELNDSSAALAAEFVLAYSPTKNLWVRAQKQAAHRKTSVADAPDSIARIVLSDVWGVGQHLDEHVVARLRQCDHQALKNAWNRHIRPQLAASGVPSKWTKLPAMADVLPSWFKGQFGEGNQLPVAMIFDQSDPLVATHRFYSRLNREQIAQYYHDTMHQLRQEIEPEAPNKSTLFPWKYAQRIGPQGTAGDGKAPPLEAVRELVQAARDDALAAHPSSYERHNSYVVYVAIALAVVTGFRPVRTPIPDLTAIHRDTSAICLQEKDRLDAAHARMAVLPPSVIEQVDRYLRHAGAMVSRLPPKQSPEMRIRATKHRDTRLAGPDSEYYYLDLRKTLYFLERSGQARGARRTVECTGIRLQLRCHALAGSRCWPLASAGRHLLCNYLRERGCEQTLINAAMGHWSYGEEPWTAESAMSPILYREELRKHLEALVDDIGFYPISPR